MLCAEEGAGTEAWGGCCQWPGSAHSWMKRFHVPPPSPQLPLITAASTPAHPPFAPCSSISPLGVFRGGRGGTAAPRVLLGCCPMDFQPHGLPAPWISSPMDFQPHGCSRCACSPPGCLPCALCPMLPVSVPGGQAWPPSPHLTLKAELGIYGQGGANKGVGWGEQGGGLAPPWGAVGAPSAPLLFLCSHSCSWFCIILYYSAFPPPLHSYPPPLHSYLPPL